MGVFESRATHNPSVEAETDGRAATADENRHRPPKTDDKSPIELDGVGHKGGDDRIARNAQCVEFDLLRHRTNTRQIARNTTGRNATGVKRNRTSPSPDKCGPSKAGIKDARRRAERGAAYSHGAIMP
ncbi:MAG: hypothetical protein AAFX03_05070 [Pseudomonadota bacterium]